MKTPLKAALLGAVVLPVVTACGDGLPQATDAQILAMLGESPFDPDDGPSTIPRRTEECPRVLSGLDQAIYKDMPSDMLGMFKTDCRTNLAKIISDTSRNPLSYSIEDFENKELAARISRIAADAAVKSQEFRESARKQAEADKIRARTEEIADAKRQVKQQIASLDAQFGHIDQLCSEWDREYASAKERNRYLARLKPDTCDDKFKFRVRKEANDTLAVISSLKVETEFYGRSLIPHYNGANAAYLTERIANLSWRIDELKTVKPLD
ncbi:hypothetical protein LH464_23975 [Neorhizobium sp. T786]|uniref:hypothetical protein n=1 Tax=Pseudorhizobium xiangyangii TaxID=2883104 RepID=UPI001CFF9569|nr:hypothetical protein [Neorhizobium xiangyangii]MCB5205506.1 hypothetical protein [Neorhizobium xiangyangii]